MTNDEILRNSQLVQLEILKEVVKICERHNINYFLSYGTLLGAIRHKGFIPWDDDIDISVLREDYDKLIDVLFDELAEGYFIDHNSIYLFSKVRKKGTLFLEEESEHLKGHQEIFIDIFPIDKVKENNLKFKIRTFRYKYLIYMRSSHFKTKENVSLMKRIIRSSFKIFKLYPLKKYNKKLTKIMTKESYGDGSFFVDYNLLTLKKKSNDILFEKRTFKNHVNVEFEGELYKSPKDYDYILKKNYGDYMKLPPKDKRKPSHAKLISFDNKTFYKYD